MSEVAPKLEPDKKVSELVRLRQRFLDLQKLGALSPETFGTFQQSFMEVFQAAERQRQTCMAQAEDYRRKASAAESQAHAFSTISSILYSIVDGHIGIEQKRLREEQEQKMREDGSLPKTSASGASYEDDPPAPAVEPPPAPEPPKPAPKRGRPKGSKNK